MAPLNRLPTLLLRRSLQQPQATHRFLTTTPTLRKTATETVKDAAKQVDATVSGAAVKGIDKGEQAAKDLKHAAGIKSAEAKGKAEELKGKAEVHGESVKEDVKDKVSS